MNTPLTVEEAIAHAVAAALRRERYERHERRRLRREHHDRSRSRGAAQPQETPAAPAPEEPAVIENDYPEEWPSPDEVPAEAPATTAKYGGIAASTLLSSGSSQSMSDTELRARLRASASGADTGNGQDSSLSGMDIGDGDQGASVAGRDIQVPGIQPPPPRARSSTPSEPPAAAVARPIPPPQSAAPLPGFPLGLAVGSRQGRRKQSYPRGHALHTGPRLLYDPLPPHLELCRKYNREDCTGTLIMCPFNRAHLCSQCGDMHPATQCTMEEEYLPLPDPPQGPPRPPGAPRRQPSGCLH